MTTYISSLKSKLRSAFPQIKLQDIVGMIEEVDPKKSNNAASYLLSLISSFQEGLPFRYIQLSAEKAHVIIPAWRRNKNTQDTIDEGVIISVCTHMLKTIWGQHQVAGIFSFQTQKINMDLQTLQPGDLHLRLELSESYRESILSLLRQNQTAVSQHQIVLFTKSEQILGTVHIDWVWSWSPTLSQPSGSTKTQMQL